ncbi:MAG: HAD family hydrolase [Candidatus Angelobacter sp. Gp1-AA117]|nr:MAG: HAD family hydrolase [Candidatus Angelobacter sp. Gp1-AA117]
MNAGRRRDICAPLPYSRGAIVSELHAVIFDIDGTLTDSVDIHALAWQEALRHFGHEIPYLKIRQQIGKGGDQLLKTLLSEEDLKGHGEKLDKYRGDLFKRKYMKQIRPFSLVRELFERIRQDGMKITLASSAKEDEVAEYKKLLEIANLVDEATSADDAGQTKPCPDIFEAALQRLGNPPVEEVIVIGDSPYDAQAASALDIRCVGVLSGGFSEEELREAGCVAIFRGPAELLARFDESPLKHLLQKAA